MIPRFTGTYKPRLDDKGRLFLPAKFRDQLSGGVVLTKGAEGCLRLYPTAEFTRQGDVVAAGDQSTKEARDAVRVFFAGASDQVPDKQGRVSLTPELRSYAGLEREAVVIGIYDRVEIWEPSAWARYTADQEQAFANLSEEVFPGF